jgi:hexulose-6-phosphate isomerase
VNEIGITQGRLSPPVPGRLQAFPWSSWEEEFSRARGCGFDIVEWLFEAERYEQNPICTATGLAKIRRQIAATGVQLRSVCASYFMTYPFFRVSEQERARSISVLNDLIRRAAALDVRTILLPVLEASEIRTGLEKVQLLDALSEPLSLAATHGIRLGLETELPASEYRDLVERGNHPALGVYYDAGNAAARGYDIAADLFTLSPFLCGVHIKDRKRGGPNVSLGQGDADFVGFFRVLAEVGYTGPLVLETASGEDYLSIASGHLKFVKDRLVWGKSVRPTIRCPE